MSRKTGELLLQLVAAAGGAFQVLRALAHPDNLFEIVATLGADVFANRHLKSTLREMFLCLVGLHKFQRYFIEEIPGDATASGVIVHHRAKHQHSSGNCSCIAGKRAYSA